MLLTRCFQSLCYKIKLVQIVYQVYECAVRNSVDTSVNGHVMMVQRFECQSDPGGYVVGGISSRLGLPRQTGL